MPVELKNIAVMDKPKLENLFQFYLYDMSEFAGWPISDDGTFAYPADLLSPYWEQANHHPYFIVSKGEIAGFSLVRRSPENDDLWDMGQFFVLRKFRGTGIGRLAFSKSLKNHHGHWQVRVLPNNRSAYRFWKTTIKEATGGDFSEEEKRYNTLNMTYFSFQIDA